jgi:hypothetical protein
MESYYYWMEKSASAQVNTGTGTSDEDAPFRRTRTLRGCGRAILHPTRSKIAR